MATHARSGVAWSERRWLLVTVCVLACACSGPDASTYARSEVRRILDDDRYEWITIETEHARVHYTRGSYAASRADELPGRAEGSIREVLSRLALPGSADPLHIFYVDGRDDMAHLTGRPVTGFSYSGDRAIVVVFNEGWRPFETHELTHVITMSSWPEAGDPAVIEGLATLADGSCGGYGNGRLARTILERGSMIPLAALSGEFRRQDDLVAYLEAASVIEFVLERSGPEVLPALWTGGLGSAPGLLGLSDGTFERELNDWLVSRYDPVSEAEWAAVQAGGCGSAGPQVEPGREGIEGPEHRRQAVDFGSEPPESR